MIPDIAIMVFAFGLVLMIYIAGREPDKSPPRFVRSLAIVAIIAAVICLWDVIEKAGKVDRDMAAAQNAMRNIGAPQQP